MNAKSHLSQVGALTLLFPIPSTTNHLTSRIDCSENTGGGEYKMDITECKEADNDEPKKREALAYKIEYAAKIVYPVLFFFFNLSYWSYYLHYYAISDQLFSV